MVAMPNNEKMVVTPWEVRGKVDYEKLIRQFGTQPITDLLLQKLQKHLGELHPQLRRKLFFSHRDLDTVLELYEKGTKFVLYTGRGPSGPVHVGHLVPWIFTKYLQDEFKTNARDIVLLVVFIMVAAGFVVGDVLYGHGATGLLQ